VTATLSKPVFAGKLGHIESSFVTQMSESEDGCTS
jgi:hypothetical protein